MIFTRARIRSTRGLTKAKDVLHTVSYWVARDETDELRLLTFGRELYVVSRAPAEGQRPLLLQLQPFDVSHDGARLARVHLPRVRSNSATIKITAAVQFISAFSRVQFSSVQFSSVRFTQLSKRRPTEKLALSHT